MTYGGLALGARGERIAAEWYEANGYVVITRNWHCDIGEIDLVVRRGNELVIAEVKTRASERFGVPVRSGGLRQATQAPSTRGRGSCGARTMRFDEVRFDVVSIVGRDVDVIEAAF